jgi:hypothetical protein
MNTKNFPFTVKVPSSTKIKDLKSLTWQSLVFYNQLRIMTFQHQTNGLWINLSSKTLLKRFGKHYATHIAELAKRDWIEINPKYAHGYKVFTKSYRLSDTTFAQKHKDHITFLGKQSWEKFAKKPSHEDSSNTSEYLQLIEQRHEMLHVPKMPKSLAGKKLKAKLDQKISSISRKSGGRVYSTIIQIDKNARKHVVFGKFGRLVNVDIRAAAPQILNIGINDPKWERWIRKGFLKCFAEAVEISPIKKTATKAFMAALSKKPKSERTQEIARYLTQEFPEIMEKVDSLNLLSTVQRETQQQESRLVAEFIQSHKHLTVIPAHDGVFCGEFEAIEVQEALEAFLKQKGMLGLVSVTPDLPNLRRRTVVDILESIFSDEPVGASHAA